MIKNSIVVGVMSLLLTSCASSGVQVTSKMPAGSKVAILQFGDCAIPKQEDCIGSGSKASAEYAKVFETVVLPRTDGLTATDSVSAQSAADLGKEKGFEYVLTGQVTERYDVAPFTFRADRAGVDLKLLKTADASVVAVQVLPSVNASSNFATPEGMFGDFAKMMKDELK